MSKRTYMDDLVDAIDTFDEEERERQNRSSKRHQTTFTAQSLPSQSSTDEPTFPGSDYFNQPSNSHTRNFSNSVTPNEFDATNSGFDTTPPSAGRYETPFTNESVAQSSPEKDSTESSFFEDATLMDSSNSTTTVPATGDNIGGRETFGEMTEDDKLKKFDLDWSTMDPNLENEATGFGLDEAISDYVITDEDWNKMLGERNFELHLSTGKDMWSTDQANLDNSLQGMGNLMPAPSTEHNDIGSMGQDSLVESIEGIGDFMPTASTGQNDMGSMSEPSIDNSGQGKRGSTQAERATQFQESNQHNEISNCAGFPTGTLMGGSPGGLGASLLNSSASFPLLQRDRRGNLINTTTSNDINEKPSVPSSPSLTTATINASTSARLRDGFGGGMTASLNTSAFPGSRTVNGPGVNTAESLVHGMVTGMMGQKNPYGHIAQNTNTSQPPTYGATAGMNGGFDPLGQFLDLGLPSNIVNNLRDGRVNNFGCDSSMPNYNQSHNAANLTDSFASSADPTTTNSLSNAPTFGMLAPTKKFSSNQPRIILKQSNREKEPETRINLHNQKSVLREPENRPYSIKSHDPHQQTAMEKLAEARMNLRNQIRVLHEPETQPSPSSGPKSPTRYLERIPNVRHPHVGAKQSDRLRCCMMNGFYVFWENEGQSRTIRQNFPDEKDTSASRIAFFRSINISNPLTVVLDIPNLNSVLLEVETFKRRHGGNWDYLIKGRLTCKIRSTQTGTVAPGPFVSYEAIIMVPLKHRQERWQSAQWPEIKQVLKFASRVLMNQHGEERKAYDWRATAARMEPAVIPLFAGANVNFICHSSGE